MSGHSKWHNIQRKKNLADAKRGSVFTKHAHLITIAAREGGGDLEMNPNLKSAVENAKAANLPNTNIERAIKRGTGELNDGVVTSEVLYEGYGPLGIALLIESITDNRNRTVSNIKNTLNKHGGTMGESGSVAWMFDKKGMIIINVGEGTNMEELELKIIDAGAEDFKREGDTIEIYTAPNNLYQVRKALQGFGLKIEKAELTFIPKNTVPIDNEEKAQKVLHFMDAIEESEDVSNVFSNFDIPEELMKKMG